SRLCMASSVAGHKRAFGEDIVPGAYEDIERADLVVIAGSNLAWCHPVLYQRMTEREPGAPKPRIVVIDPRHTSSCAEADLHLPLAPGTDDILFNGLLVHLARTGKINQEYVGASLNGYDETLAAAEASAPDVGAVAAACKLDAQSVWQFYDWFARTRRSVTLYSQGINQSSSGTDKVGAILNCHLATGRIGKPGMGPFSLTGQPNAMGGREVGGLANQLAAHVDFGDNQSADAIKKYWDSPTIAAQPGLKAIDMFEAIHQGDIKALWIMGTNPAVSMPDGNRVAEALAACPFVAVSDCVQNTDTTDYADVLLPALAWGEKEGTVTNSERRISRQRKFLPAPGQARADWWIISEIAKRMGFAAGFDYQGPADIFREHAGLTSVTKGPKRLFDISDLAEIDDKVYDGLNPIQWPLARGAGTARLLGDGKFPTNDGRANLVAITPKVRAPTDPDRPFILNTGRLRDQWHTMTRTGNSPRLNQHAPEPCLDIHASDAATAGLEDGALADIQNERGRMIARVRVTDAQTPGTLFAPIHWSGRFATEARVAPLIAPLCDPISGQPELKQTAVSIGPLKAAWHGFALSRSPVEIEGADWWARSRATNHSRIEFAGNTQPADWDLWARTVLGQLHGGGEWLAFGDKGLGRYRFAVLQGGALQACLFVSPDWGLPDRGWLASLFAYPELDGADRMALLTGVPGVPGSNHSQVICACNGLTREVIEAEIDRGHASVAALGAAIGAGTTCGSCRPELAQLVAERPMSALPTAE
ncbi:MAG: molybdopterin-dependent oxidoreductase, partial [Rhodospirillales bacterium]|nr:molybdopterin-dependent oxidoreductase [Rhodospirillales bacterium]